MNISQARQELFDLSNRVMSLRNNFPPVEADDNRGMTRGQREILVERLQSTEDRLDEMREALFLAQGIPDKKPADTIARYDLVYLDCQAKYLLEDVGIGHLVTKLQQIDRHRRDKLGNYTVIEHGVESARVAIQDAAEWYKEYREYVMATGYHIGDMVSSIYKRTPVYKIEKMNKTTAWVRPCDGNGTVYGAVQKGIPYGGFVKCKP